MASISTSWPGLMRPSSMPLAGASGMEAAEGYWRAQPRWRSPSSRRCRGVLATPSQDPQVGLMRHEPVDLRHSDSGIGRRGDRLPGNVHHGVAEHLIAGHPQLASPLPVVDGPPSTHIKQVLLGPRHSAEPCRECPGPPWFPGPCRAPAPPPRPIAEQHARPRSVQSIQPGHGPAPITRAHLLMPRRESVPPRSGHRRSPSRRPAHRRPRPQGQPSLRCTIAAVAGRSGGPPWWWRQ